MEKYFDLIDSFNALSGVRADRLDPKARRHFVALASRLLDQIEAQGEEILSPKGSELLDGLFDFNDYADCFRIWDVFSRQAEDYWYVISSGIMRRADNLSDQPLEVLEPIEEELMDRARAWIDSPYWVEGRFKETQIALNRIKQTSKDPDEDRRKLREATHKDIERNLFGHVWLSVAATSVYDADEALFSTVEVSDTTVCSIIGNTIEKQHRTHQPWIPLPDPGKYGEKFDYDEELREFCQLRAAYLLLTGQNSTYFHQDSCDDTADSDSQPADTTTPPQPQTQNTIPIPLRQQMVKAWENLADTIGLDKTHLGVFNTDDEPLWKLVSGNKKGTDKGKPKYTYQNTDLAPFLIFIGALSHCRLVDDTMSYVRKIAQIPQAEQAKANNICKDVSAKAEKNHGPLGTALIKRLKERQPEAKM